MLNHVSALRNKHKANLKKVSKDFLEASFHVLFYTNQGLKTPSNIPLWGHSQRKWTNEKVSQAAQE